VLSATTAATPLLIYLQIDVPRQVMGMHHTCCGTLTHACPKFDYNCIRVAQGVHTAASACALFLMMVLVMMMIR
jgi:hypothetical protein